MIGTGWFAGPESMRHETITALYFGGLLLAFAGVPGVRRAKGLAVSAAVLAVTWLTRPGGAASGIRDWLPLFWIPLGYWLPADLVRSVDLRLEDRLARIDARLGRAIAAHVGRLPRPVALLLEMAYGLVYPAVPAGLLVVVWMAPDPAAVDLFWPPVLASGYFCYALLPVLPTRPPRSRPDATPRTLSAAARGNRWILARLSHGWNTVPSGHAAVAVAVALAVARLAPPAGPAAILLACAIAAATVTGRYHYAVDTVAGVLVGLTVTVVMGL